MVDSLSLVEKRVAGMLRKAGVPRAVELAALAEPSFKIRTQRVPLVELPPGASRFGGSPDVLPSFAWPEQEGRPLTFLAQLDLAEIHAPGVPERGWLLFFYDAAGLPWGSKPEHAGGAAVVRVEANRDTLTRVEHPDPGFGGGPFHACALTFEVVIDLPDEWDHIIEDHGLVVERHRWEAYDSVAGRLNGTEGEDELPFHYHHHFLGHPQLLQDDMRSRCLLIPRRRAGATGAGDAQESGEPGGPQPSADWRLLMQIDTDVEGPGWEWADGGRLYCWIRHADLAAGSFEKVWVILQC